MAQKITPNLWFNGNAKEAADFYLSVFSDAKVTATLYYPKSKEEGLADFQLNMASKELTIEFEVMGFRFTAINAGPEFTPNPSISFFITLNTKEEIDALWNKLKDGGKELMALAKYPFSEYYGWVQDKYNMSWQLILNRPEGDWRPKVMPSLLFTQDKNGKAEEAINFYLSVFSAPAGGWSASGRKGGSASGGKNSKTGQLVRRTEDDPMAKAGTLAFGDIMIENVWIAAMDGGQAHKFKFNEGISLSVGCQDQSEIDYYWERFTADGGEESVCGWLKDKYGVSWQVAPANMGELIKKPRVFANMMKMKKIIIADLEKMVNE